MSIPTRPSMHILEIETFGHGGLTHYAYNLSRALVARGHKVTLVTAAAFELDAVPDSGADTVSDAGPDTVPDTVPDLRIIKAIARGGHRISRRLPAILDQPWRRAEAIFDAVSVARLAHTLRPDVIHFHCTNQIALLYLGLLARLGRPLVATAHVVTPHEPIPFQDRIYRRIHRLGQLIIAHSEFDRARLEREFAVPSARTTVIPHGEYGFFARDVDAVDRASARRSLGLDMNEEVALFFGYIREYKGLDLLLEAWPQIVAERPAARLLIAGDPVRLEAGRRTELERWATRLGAVHRFDYVPFADVSRYFAAADALVMPYRHISQSGVLYLALSLGVPVVATRVGGLPEMLRDGESALLVPPELPPALADALVRALGDADLRDRLRQGGRAIAEAHSWPAIAARTEGAFADLLAI